MFQPSPQALRIGKQSAVVLVSLLAGWLLGRRSEDRAGPVRPGVSRSAALAAASPLGTNRQGSRETSAEPLKTADPADRMARARDALSEPGVSRRQRAFAAFLETMTAAEAPLLERLFTSMDRSGATFQEDNTFESFMQRWGELDAHGAMRWLEEHRGPTAKPWEMDWYRVRLLTSWAAAEPEKALEWADAKGDPQVTGEVVRGAIAALARTDPSAACRLALERYRNDSEGGRAAVNTLAEAAVRAGGAARLEEWLNTLTSETGSEDAVMRSLAVNAVAYRMVHASPEEGAKWVAAQAEKPWRNDEMIIRAAGALAETDPAAAARWSAGLAPAPTPPIRIPACGSPWRNGPPPPRRRWPGG